MKLDEKQKTNLQIPATEVVQGVKRARTGRPVKNLDEELIFRLSTIHCTMKEIAAILGCSIDTLERRYLDIIEAGRQMGKMSLRRAMYANALSGNATMQIWLSKQELGMRDKHEILADLPPIGLAYNLEEKKD